MKPLVSISCLTYNHAPYIRQCLEGFLMQRCNFEFEILIHDDASTDGAQEIIKEYQQKYPQIVKPILQTENQWSKGVRGISFKANFPRAKGKYIAMCEGDDYWIDPLKLQKQVDFMEENSGCNICFTYSDKIYEEGGKEAIKDIKELQYSQFDILLGKKYQTRTATILFNKDILKNECFSMYQGRNGDTWLKIIATENSKAFVLPFISAVYRIHAGGIWSHANFLYKKRAAYNDWRVKIKYALKKNFKVVPHLFVKLIKSFFAFHVFKFMIGARKDKMSL